MSKLLLIGLIKRNNKIVKLRFLNYNNINEYNIADIEYSNVIRTLHLKGNGCIENLALENGILKGVNGSIDRYGVINNDVKLSSSIVIIDKVIGDNGETLGYDCCGISGKVWRLRISDVIKYAHQNGIANGKLVEVDKNIIISAIEGYYDEVKLNAETDNKNNNDSNKTENIESKAEKVENKNNSYNVHSTDSNDFEVIDINDKTVQITEFTGKSGSIDIVIPEKIGNKTVVSIGQAAFKGTKIRTLKVGSNITDIGQYAFSQCRKLELVDLSRGRHKFIANGTFDMCASLKAIKIGDNVERIHEYAFRKTFSLEKIEFPKSLATIARHAFELSGITSIKHYGSVKSINDSAFEGCYKLTEFDFDGVNTIGARAFALSGLQYVVISSSVNKIGRYAFYNCKIKDVNIEEGVNEICEYAFTANDKQYNTEKYAAENVYIPKSVTIFGNNCLSSINKVFVYHGSQAESYCVGHGIDFDYIDKADKKNSSSARLRANMINASVINILADKLSKASDEDINVKLNEEKLVHIKINSDMYKKLGIEGIMAECSGKEEYTESVFNEIVNYLTATHKLYKTPLDYTVMRCYGIMYIESESIFSANNMAVIRMHYFKKDNLDEARFIIAVKDDELIFVCDDDNTTCINANDVGKTGKIRTDYVRILHTGDTIGADASIAGEEAKIVEVNGSRMHLGKTILSVLQNSAIRIEDSAHEEYYKIVGSEHVIKIADQRTYDKDKRVRRGTPDCLNIVDVINDDELHNRSVKRMKATIDNKKLFNELKELSDSDVINDNNRLETVFAESISELYIIAKKFREEIGETDKPDISMMSAKLFSEIANTYWMIEKDIQWYNSIGRSSLNLVAKYNIEKYTVEEYISNQIVKFYNPYMQGGKGAYVFVLKNGNRAINIYASRMSLSSIAKKLYDMVDYDKEEVRNIDAPMSRNTGKIEAVNSDLFFKFYDVLEHKNGWKYLNGYSASNCEFAISLYKPTGVMYIVMYDVEIKQGNDGKSVRRELVCRPIFKIGDIDRALEIASTTNNNKRAKDTIKEIVDLATYIGNHGYRYMQGQEVYNRYMIARELAINGEARRSEYEGLINERLSLMIGINSINGPRVYNSIYKNTRIQYEEDEEDYGDVEVEYDDTEYEQEETDTEQDEVGIEINTEEVNIEQDEETEEGMELDMEYDENEEDYDVDYDNDDEEMYDNDDTEQTSGMIEMMVNMSKEELAEIGMTVEQRDDMVNKMRRGELTIQ